MSVFSVTIIPSADILFSSETLVLLSSSEYFWSLFALAASEGSVLEPRGPGAGDNLVASCGTVSGSGTEPPGVMGGLA